MKKGIGILMLLLTIATGSNGEVLVKNPVNPRYFAHAGSSEAVYLTGSHTWNLIVTDDPDMPTYEAMERYLDWVQSFGHNYIRLWTNRSYNTHTPVPWNLIDGDAVMDEKWNEDYFNYLAERVNQVTSRGMYCSVMLFGSGVGFKDDWQGGTYWHPDYNTSAALDAAFSATDGDSFYTSNTAAFEVQKALIRKTIDTLNDEDRIFWEVINEPNLPASATWHNTIMAYIREFEAAKPKQHLIMMSGEGAAPSTSDEQYLFKSNADIISPDNLSPYSITQGGNASYSSKIIMNDTDHITGYSDPDDAVIYRKWVWRAFCRGTNVIFMDSYDDNIPPYNDGYINPVFDPVRAAMGHTKRYADRMDLRYALPSTSFSSTGYALVHPGRTYLIYQPDTGSFTYSLPPGYYNYEWFNPNTGIVTATGTMKGAKKLKSTPPYGSVDAVLFIEPKSP